MDVPANLAELLIQQDRRALAKAITLAESDSPANREAAVQLLEQIHEHTGKSFRIGISGAPGVGKSTFIEAFGLKLIDQGHRVCVLTIDPSSRLSGGSILGDKTRMPRLGTHPSAYVRPTPSGNQLGGVARRTREAILLAEVAGYDIIIIETVGVGQSEVSVSNLSDMFLLLLQPGSGDDLQGIKRGVMELADMIVVNKADGELVNAANRSASSYLNALQLIKPKPKNMACDWSVPVLICSSIVGTGLDQLVEKIDHYNSALTEYGEFHRVRDEQNQYWFHEELIANFEDALLTNPVLKKQIEYYSEKVRNHTLTPVNAAKQFIKDTLSC